MCRFAAYSGPSIRLAALLTRPSHGLVDQARHSYEAIDVENPDGWGVAWYRPGLARPALVKEITPAWQSESLPALAQEERSTCILAHVRAATEGLAVTRENCHPFTWRGLSFMHNGAIYGFDAAKPALLRSLSPRARRTVHGTTDSEYIFALFTDHWLAAEGAPPARRLTQALRATIASIADLRRACRVTQPSFLNIAVSDGRATVVSRATIGRGAAARSLYWCTARRIVRRDEAEKHTEPYVLVASEPLDTTRRWMAIPPGRLIVVDEQRRVEILPVKRARARSTRVA